MNTNRTTYHINIEGGLWTIDEDEASRKSIEDLGRYKAALEEAKVSIIGVTSIPYGALEQYVPSAPATGPLSAPKVMIGGYATKAMMSDEIDKRIRIVSDEIDRKAMNGQYKEGDLVEVTMVGMVSTNYGDGKYLIRVHGEMVPVLASQMKMVEEKSIDE